ncbi:MAG: polysaccharide lyase family 7 protein [Pseudonocardia sp.]
MRAVGVVLAVVLAVAALSVPGQPSTSAASSVRPRSVALASGSPGSCQPGQVLDLSSWKLTLPTGSSGAPTEILPVKLGNLVDSQFFQSTPDCDGVVFRAPVNGVTTKGSHYPRSELREMGGGNGAAAWSAGSGTHWMAVTEAFTTLPRGKSEVVGAQIHDDKDDVSVFRLEGSNLYVTDGNNPHYKLVTGNYQLGAVFEAAFLVTQNMIGAYYNGQLVAELDKPFSNAYFKAGAYTQANCSNSPCSADNFGETVIYDLATGHS